MTAAYRCISGLVKVIRAVITLNLTPCAAFIVIWRGSFLLWCVTSSQLCYNIIDQKHSHELHERELGQ